MSSPNSPKSSAVPSHDYIAEYPTALNLSTSALESVPPSSTTYVLNSMAADLKGKMENEHKKVKAKDGEEGGEK